MLEFFFLCFSINILSLAIELSLSFYLIFFPFYRNSAGTSLSSYSSGAINTTNSSDPLLLRQQQQSGTNLVSMTQDLGFHWANNSVSSQLVKQETSLDSYPRFTQMLKSPSNIEERELSDMNAKLLFGTLSNSGCQMINTGLQLYPGDHNLLYSSNSSSSTNNRGKFSQIYPTINVSNLNINQASYLANSSSLDMNLQPLDLVNTSRYGGSFSQPYGLTNHFQHSSSESPVDSSSSVSISFLFLISFYAKLWFGHIMRKK